MKQEIEFPVIAKRLLAAAGAGLFGLAALTACDAAASDGSGGSTDSGGDTAEKAAETCEVAPAEEGAGTDFEAPLATCQAASIPGWDVAVTAVELDATETVLDANTFNEDVADGTQYLMYTLTAINTGDAAADPFLDLTTSVDIGDLRYDETCGVLPNDMVDVGEIAPGDSFTANDCDFIDSEGAESAVLAVSSLMDMESTEVYFKLG
ncbi:hypothetical protein [Glycomyces buryatensis]|uniref:DUF4352 domain-containing protein n=1 Tax=Glycomyces buryatensis TaxID=2570927 RepID=A0A4S8Q8Q9_9ACTN|nr:hypothetical protein [Glycomyces buryatensis]THV40787.1 hypothetical protein FAB82_14150 [Glycomyces buryatensis]